MGLPWGAVVKVLPLPNHCVGVAFFQPPNALHDAGLPPGTLPGTNTPALLLRCPAPDAAASLYALLWSRRDLMADPRGMPDPRDLEPNPPGKGWVCTACTLANRPLSPRCEACGAAKQHASSGSRSSGEGGSVGAVYVFGGANEPTKMGLTKAEANYDERQLLEVSAVLDGPSCFPLDNPLQKSFRCRPRCHLLVGPRQCFTWRFCFVPSPHVAFFQVTKAALADALASNRKATANGFGVAAKAALDETAWRFCLVFTGTHRLLSSKRVAVLLLLNESASPVQVRSRAKQVTSSAFSC
jgi:hypothetical protein